MRGEEDSKEDACIEEAWASERGKRWKGKVGSSGKAGVKQFVSKYEL